MPVIQKKEQTDFWGEGSVLDRINRINRIERQRGKEGMGVRFRTED